MVGVNSTKRKAEGEEHATKKSKAVKDIPEDVIHNAWSHYRSFLESEEESNEENEPDFDELHEIIGQLESYVEPVEEVSTSSLSLPSIESLILILLSMVYLHLGDDAISKGFQDGSEDDSVEKLLQKSLKYFPKNAASLSMLANYQRMNLSASLIDICETYRHAAASANEVRKFALSVLAEEEEQEKEDENDEAPGTENMYKEWVELLLLNGVAGVEFIGEDEEEDQESDNEGGDNGQSDSPNVDTENAEQGEIEEYSTSQVEATSCFMAALLQSTLKIHDDALASLSKFDFTHRIHPNVWLAATDATLLKGQSSDTDENLLFEPKSFTDALPSSLYKRLCNVFSPSATFWKESDYQNRGYYSFYEDVMEASFTKPRNLIDNVIVNHLLPLAQSAVPSEKIVGYEWWAHTRPLQANLGHQLHFDTDETLLGQEKKVTHPIVSSVLYLTGNKSKEKKTAGATIVFGQTPDSKQVASKAYVSHAQDGKYMIFPGNCLHGVLPCSGKSESSEETPVERLTLMVGFWTRRVPDKMKDRHLYGPCGPLPETSDEHTWVAAIQQTEDCTPAINPKSSNNKDNSNITAENIPHVSPAWEDITSHVEKSKDPKLDIPISLDHRFFVKDASSCFRQSLFRDESFGH